MKMTIQMQYFSFVHKYALKMQVKKKPFISFQTIQVNKKKHTYKHTKHTHTHIIENKTNIVQ
jgi:hypothetical protein